MSGDRKPPDPFDLVRRPGRLTEPPPKRKAHHVQGSEGSLWCVSSVPIHAGEGSKIAEGEPRHRFFWENILVLAMTHLLGMAGIAYAIFVSFSWWTAGLALLWFFLCVLSTTGGYHRLFAHRTYRAAKGVRLFYLLFGAASGQGSVLRWAADHRRHHAHTDEPEDPHNIKRGFWWAHMGWLLIEALLRA